jgi:hypothetical protein
MVPRQEATMSTQLTATLVTLLALPGAAFAHEGAPDLHVATEYESCYFDLHPELTEGEFRTWAAEGGQIVRSRQLSGADTLGRGGLDVSIGYAYFFLDDTKGAWNNTMSHPNGDHPLGSQLGFPQLSLRVGVHRNVDAEVYGALNWNSNYGFVGIASKIRLLRQSEDMPISVSVRPSLSALAGPSEVQLVDVVPTVMELVTGKTFPAERGSAAPRYPGKSLIPAFANDESVKRDSIWFLHEANRALRVGDWNIVAAGLDAPWELYILAADRAETRNLAKEQPAKLRELVVRWESETKEYQKWAEKDAPPVSPAKAVKKKASKA